VTRFAPIFDLLVALCVFPPRYAEGRRSSRGCFGRRTVSKLIYRIQLISPPTPSLVARHLSIAK
jgi:hypothetical protein